MACQSLSHTISYSQAFQQADSTNMHTSWKLVQATLICTKLCVWGLLEANVAKLLYVEQISFGYVGFEIKTWPCEKTFGKLCKFSNFLYPRVREYRSIVLCPLSIPSSMNFACTAYLLHVFTLHGYTISIKVMYDSFKISWIFWQVLVLLHIFVTSSRQKQVVWKQAKKQQIREMEFSVWPIPFGQ